MDAVELLLCNHCGYINNPGLHCVEHCAGCRYAAEVQVIVGLFLNSGRPPCKDAAHTNFIHPSLRPRQRGLRRLLSSQGLTSTMLWGVDFSVSTIVSEEAQARLDADEWDDFIRMALED